MLSIENPPSDPPCPCHEFPHLKSGSDERASHKLPLPDHLDPPLDHHHHRIPLPNFSIRDYVFTSRSKDITKNWPFSLENLQLCLKNGIKDPLPPFQPLNTVRDQSSKKCAVETSLPEIEKKTVVNVVDEEPYCVCATNDHKLDYAQSNHKYPCIGIDHYNTTACKSVGENGFPSTTTSVSQSEIESVPASRPSSTSPLEADTLLEASDAALSPSSCKAETTSRPTSKKCRLIVKFGANSDRISTEDIASNCTAVSETMASKTCPVCKTFSSSSNTTLNAHIDQCLSAESTPKWTADSKLNRHKIKPRKIRLMTDIYATAQWCTLEELDKRNGTSWARVSSLPAPDTEKFDASDEGKNQGVSPVHPEDAGDVGPVYIDASGTKLRILSKLNDAPLMSEMGKDLVPNKALNEGKASQFFSTKKKWRHGKKYHKYLKLAPQSRKFFSHKAHASQMREAQEGYSGVEESHKEELQIPKQIKPSEPGNLRQWVCSKRTGLAKKLNKKGCKWHAARNLPVENDQSCLGDSLVKRNQVQKLTNLSESPISRPEHSHRTEKPFYEARISDKRELSSGRKQSGTPLLGARIIDNKESSLPPMKQNTNKLSKDSPSGHDSHTMRPPDSTRNCASPFSKKTFCTDAVNYSDIPPRRRIKPSTETLPFSSKALRFSSSRKNLSCVSSQSSVIESRPNVVKKRSALKKAQLHIMAEADEELETWQSEMGQQCALMHNGIDNQGEGEEIIDNMSFCRGSVTGVRQNRRPLRISRREETVALKSSQRAAQCYGKVERENIDSSVRVDDDKFDSPEPVGGTVTSLSKSVDTKFHRLSNHSKTRSDSPQDYSGLLCGGEAVTGPAEPSFVGGQEMYCADEVGNGIIGQTAHVGVELDSHVGQGNSFPDVDPIPIPGPPGSFLPSPRDMGSDDFPGNSSLTTSRVHSSADQLDFIDGDSSESPISVASAISNSMAARSDLKYSEPLSSVGAPSVQEKITSGFSMANVEHSVDTAASARQTSTGAERDGERFTVHKLPIEKKLLSFKNDDQPCCCQRKEKFSQGVTLNYQDSQLLRRRTMASVTVPVTGKQMGLNPNTRPSNLDMRPEIISMSSCPTSGSGKVALPLMKPPADPFPLKGSPDAAVKFSGRFDCDSASPSASNPILRLMGKNLMVVNKEEDASVPLGQAQSSSQNNHPTSQFYAPSSVSPGSFWSQDINSFHHMASRGSLIFGQNPHDGMGQYLDVRNGFRNHTISRIPQTPAQVPEGMFHNQCIDGGFAASMEPSKYEGDYNLSGRHTRPKNKLGAASTYNMENVMTALDSEHRPADSSAALKEVIVIDDVFESEANLTGGVVKYSEGLRKSQVVSCGIPIAAVQSYNSRHGSSFSCYQSWEPPLHGESPVVQNTKFHAIPSRVLHRGPFVAAPSSTDHVRSALFYSPS